MPRILTLAAIFILGSAAAQAQTGNPGDRKAVFLTVYQNNLALIDEQRRIDSPAPDGSVVIDGVPGAIIPESLLVETDSADRHPLLEQRYETGLLTPETLLRHAEGQAVQVIRTDPSNGSEIFTEAEVLRAQGREALVRMNGLIRLVPVSRLAFGSAPAGLHARPKLVLTFAPAAAPKTLSLRYLTGGLQWRATYVGALNADETAVRLTGWTTLSNNTGIAYQDARLRIVSGSINRTAQRRFQQKGTVVANAAIARESAPVESAVSDLHVFTFDRQISIGGQETRQLALLPERLVPVEKEYRLQNLQGQFNRPQRGTARGNPAIWLRFKNARESGLGGTLPAGILRLYSDAGDGAVFLGESRLRHTPPGEAVRATVGTAVDITAERRQTDFRREGLPRNVFESAHSLTLRNAKKIDATVIVTESIPGDWEILSESRDHTPRDAGSVQWRIPVPAGGSAELTYRVRVRF